MEWSHKMATFSVIESKYIAVDEVFMEIFYICTLL